MTPAYDRSELVSAIGDAVGQFFASEMSKSRSAPEIRALMDEAMRMAIRAAAAVHPQFEEQPLKILAAMIEGAEGEARDMKAKLMRPGRHWRG